MRFINPKHLDKSDAFYWNVDKTELIGALTKQLQQLCKAMNIII